ncbi:MAG TPA: hypothetical protein VGG84_10330 [Gemmatimonadaceae bacterium]
MAHAGSTTWHEILHRLQNRGANPDAVELLILAGLADVMAIQDSLEIRMEQIMTAAQNVVDTAAQLIASLDGVLGQFEAAVTALQSGAPVNTDGLAAAVTAGQTALSTAQAQLSALTPPATTPPVTTPPATTPPADGSTAPAAGSTDTTTA